MRALDAETEKHRKRARDAQQSYERQVSCEGATTPWPWGGLGQAGTARGDAPCICC